MEPSAHRAATSAGVEPSPSPLDIALDHQGRSVTVSLRGDLDASTCADLRDELLGLVGSGHHDVVVVDCAGVGYCGMLGQAVLRRAHREAVVCGRRLVLRNLGPRMSRLARMSGLDEVLGAS